MRQKVFGVSHRMTNFKNHGYGYSNAIIATPGVKCEIETGEMGKVILTDM